MDTNISLTVTCALCGRQLKTMSGRKINIVDGVHNVEVTARPCEECMRASYGKAWKDLEVLRKAGGKHADIQV